MTETTQNSAAVEAKTPKAKAPKKPVKAKTAAKSKAKAAKPNRDKTPKEDLMTFAFRMPKAESAALHKAAGPANASRVMRALALAFSHEDEGAFKSIVLEAKKLRA